jgi:hypothetical protein
MKWIILIAMCIVLLCAGCLDQKNGTDSGVSAGDKSVKVPTVTITSPKPGEILKGNKDVTFDAVTSGKEPLTYSWTSNIDGELSTSRKFAQNPSRLSKGGHMIILKVTDAYGTSAQGTVPVEVM